MNLKTRADFTSDLEYYQYANTEEFLVNYSIEGKKLEEVMSDLVLPNDWINYAEVVYKNQMNQKQFGGIYFVNKVDDLVIADEDYFAELEKLEKK